MSNFFEYKFLAIENYYKYVCLEKNTYVQAAGRCVVDFQLDLLDENVRALALYSTILAQVAKYIGNMDHFKQEYECLMNIYNVLSLDTLLTDNEKSYLNDDIDFIKFKLEK